MKYARFIRIVMACSLGLIAFVTYSVSFKQITKPFEQAGATIKSGTEQYIIDPVTGVVVGSKEAIEGIIAMANRIQALIPGVEQAIATTTAQIDTLSKVENGQEIIDPLFEIVQSLNSIPWHLQKILNAVAHSIGGFDTIVRPFKASEANKIKEVVDSVKSIELSIKDVNQKITIINESLHTHTKNISREATQLTNDIVKIIKE